MIQAAVTKPLSLVSEEIFSLECPLTKTQQATLAVHISSLFFLRSLTFTKIAAGSLITFTANRLWHFLKYSPLSASVVLLATIKWSLAYMRMQHATCRLVIEDTMEHHSKGCRTIVKVYWLFPPYRFMFQCKGHSIRLRLDQ